MSFRSFFGNKLTYGNSVHVISTPRLSLSSSRMCVNVTGHVTLLNHPTFSAIGQEHEVLLRDKLSERNLSFLGKPTHSQSVFFSLRQTKPLNL